jgi:predicted permease
MKSLVFICGLALIAAMTVIANRLLSALFAGYSPDPRWVVLAILTIPPVYFLPSILAASKGHPHGPPIFLVNILLGWTIMGWLACLVWAASLPGERKPYTPLIPRPVRRPAAPSVTAESAAQALEALVMQRYNGQITEAEYQNGRQVILDQWPRMPLAAV